MRVAETQRNLVRIKHQLSYFRGCFHFLHSIVGMGLLMVPWAFQSIGWLVAVAILPFYIILATCSLHLMLKAKNEMCSRRRIMYMPLPIAMREAVLNGPRFIRRYSHIAEMLVDVVLVLHYVGCTVACICLVGEQIKDIFDYFGFQLDLRIYMYLQTCPLLILIMLKNFRVLIPFNVISILLMHTGCYYMIYYLYDDLDMAMIKKEPFVNDMLMLPLYSAVILFSSCPVGVILNIEGDMRNPGHFLERFGILNIGMVYVLIIIISIGLAGSWTYSNQIADNILINLPISNPLCFCVKLAVTFAVYLSYPMQAYVIVDIVWYEYLIADTELLPPTKIMLEKLFRILVVVSTVMLAMFMQHFQNAIIFFGSLTQSMLVFIIPAVMDMCVQYKAGHKAFRMIFIRDFMLIWCGLIIFVSGPTVLMYLKYKY